MADLEIKGLDDDLYEKIVKSAKVRDISVNQQVLNIIKKFFTFDMDGSEHGTAAASVQASVSGAQTSSNPAQPVKNTDTLVADICSSKISQIRFQTGDGITDATDASVPNK